VYTGYYNTSRLCIGFAYAFMGSSGQIRVIAIAEDKEEREVATIQHNSDEFKSDSWYYHFAELPDGINIIMIEGKRPSNGSCGISLDDIEVKRCELFKGKYYMYTVRVHHKLKIKILIHRVVYLNEIGSFVLGR
jgi:hypothetical protein